MLIKDFLRGQFGLHRDKFVPFGLESGDNISDNSALDSIRFDLRFSVQKRKMRCENYSQNHSMTFHLLRTMM